MSSEHLVESMPGDGKVWAKVLVKCHGQEELAKFNMGSADWKWEDLARVMGRHEWFDPRQMAGVEEER